MRIRYKQSTLRNRRKFSLSHTEDYSPGRKCFRKTLCYILTDQRMYIKRGFIPDGTGLWWQGKNLEPYADMKNDDETAIYMSKKL